MAAETQYTANTGIASLTMGTSSLTGSGSTQVLAAGSNGTLIESVFIKAAVSTTEGMVRLFIYDGGSIYNLVQEIHVPPITQAPTTPTFEFTWACNITLKSGYYLYASAENSQNFMVIANGLDWTYFSNAVRPESTKFTANTGVIAISSGSSSLTSSSNTLLTAGASPTYNGCKIDSVTITAQGNVTTGMIRLFVVSGGTTAIIKEVCIPGVVASANEPAFSIKIPLGGLNLKTGYVLKVNTQNSEAFAITAEGRDWSYPPASSVSNFTPASGTSTTNEELLHSLAVPAGLFSTGDLMRVYADLVMTGSGNKTFRIYENSVNSLSGATKLATVVYTTETSGSIMRLFPVISATSLGAFGGATQNVQTQYAANAGTTANITVATLASAAYILISGQKATAGDTDTVQWSIVQKDNTYSL